MIKNETQRAITEKWLKEFKDSLKKVKNLKQDPRITKVCFDGIKSIISDLEFELQEYDKKE